MGGLQLVVLLHIVAAVAAILSGALAMTVRKGGARHRQAGIVFCFTMLTMSTIGAYLGVVGGLHPPQATNVLVGTLTFYLVATAWSTARARTAGVVDAVATTIGLALAIASGAFAVEALRGTGGPEVTGGPAGYVVIGMLALLHVGSDLRVLLRGTTRCARVARHLWRMSFAMLIATTSLFVGQPRMMPEAVRGTPWVFVPSIAIVLLIVLWLWQTWRGRFGRAIDAREPSEPRLRAGQTIAS